MSGENGRNPLLEVRDLETGYGLLRIVRGISFELYEDEILAIVGANGVGKTTLMNALVGQLRVWAGEVSLAGRAVSRLSAHRIVAAGIALVPEGRRVFAELSVAENLLVGAHTRRDRGVRDDLDRWLRFFPVLGERRAQNAGSLSGGEQQMLAIARALMSRPKVLLLDEPSLGLAPLVVRDVFKTVGKIREEGTAVVLVEQNARLALETSHRALVMQRGQIAIEGRSSDLAGDERVRDIYLGHAVSGA
ncbi:MAG: branched-chain amino acid transport system ATP-binding protein [Actinomycetota bacterium]|jgi:branched-chain amino acid transport system ATP-binding protein